MGEFKRPSVRAHPAVTIEWLRNESETDQTAGKVAGGGGAAAEPEIVINQRQLHPLKTISNEESWK